MPSSDVRRARLAVCAAFATNGALFANLVPRYPEIKDTLGIDVATFGLALAALPAGSLVSGLSAPWFISRFGSSRVATLGTPLAALALWGLTLAPQVAWLALALFLAGAIDALVDVGQNTHGMRVQRLYGRSIVNTFHGIWSIGAVVGGLMGAAAVGFGIPIRTHVAVSGLIMSVVVVYALRFFLPGPDTADPVETDDPAPRPPASSTRVRLSPRVLLLLGALGLVAAAGASVEDAGSSWSALYMQTVVGVAPAFAGLAFVSLMTAMTIGRLLGDRLIDVAGADRIGLAGGLCIALGMGLAIAVPAPVVVLIGFALAGWGTATLVPGAMHAADEIPSLPTGLGIAVVGWLLRLGFLLMPPLVGAIAEATDLRIALLVVVAGGLSATLLSPTLRPDRRSPFRHDGEKT